MSGQLSLVAKVVHIEENSLGLQNGANKLTAYKMEPVFYSPCMLEFPTQATDSVALYD